MNSVSWFIYLAQVSGSLGALFIFFGCVGIAGIIAFFTIPRMYKAIEEPKNYTPPIIKTRYIAASIVFLIIGNLMPDRNTMYAIAASQVGEQIVNSGIANDATKALQQWIKRQIEPEEKKSK